MENSSPRDSHISERRSELKQTQFAELTRKQVLEVVGLANLPVQSRISDVLVDQLRYGLITNFVHPNRVVDEILGLESGKDRTLTAPASAFRGDILRGIYKKHFFQSSFIVQNIMNELKLSNPSSKKFEGLYRRLAKKTSDKWELAGLIAEECSSLAFERRSRNRKLTGEWIIFCKHNGENYYLMLASHKDLDCKIRDLISSECVREFPFLTEILSAR